MADLQRDDDRPVDPLWRRRVSPVLLRGASGAGRARAAQDRTRRVMRAVLIVDSYIDEAEMYTQYLRSRGADVEFLRRPEEALTRVLDAPPAVIVADMVFEWSAYDGPGFVRALRQRPECAMTNFIVLSGFTRAADRQRARVAGADRFLVKPCAPDELWRHVSSAVWAHERTLRAAWNWPDDGPAEPSPMLY